jgi:hypothetical protein
MLLDWVSAAEDEARLRGCKHAFLHTFSFQALGFYQKLDFTEFDLRGEFSGKHERHYQRSFVDSANVARILKLSILSNGLPGRKEFVLRWIHRGPQSLERMISVSRKECFLKPTLKVFERHHEYAFS